MKYRIYELSAKALMNYVREDEKKITFRLTENETKKCMSFSAPEYQEDCALFFQTMCVLHGDDYFVPLGTQTVNDLSDIIVYIDFSGIFDRRAVQKIYADRQRWAKEMFSPAGFTLNILVSQGFNRIFFIYLFNGVYHTECNNYKYTCNRYNEFIPRNIKSH